MCDISEVLKFGNGYCYIGSNDCQEVCPGLCQAVDFSMYCYKDYMYVFPFFQPVLFPTKKLPSFVLTLNELLV